MLIAALALVAPAAATRLRTGAAAAVAGLAAAAYLVAAQLLFEAGSIIPVVHPLFALALGVLGTAVLGQASRPAPATAVTDADATAPDDGATLPDRVTVGDEIAGLRLEECIGGGGMGVIFRAEQPALARKVAVKVIAPALAADPRFRERFSREARVAAAIDHPHVLPVYAAGDDRGRLYLVMRYVEGTDLARRLRAGGPLPPAAAVEIVGQVASALDAAHARGVVHRDVKPANILLVERAGAAPHCYLTDFGITRDLSATHDLTQTGAFMGSVEYVAPEMVGDGRAGPAADVYALGCVAFECVTGQPPFHRDHDVATLWAHVNDPPPSASRLIADLPPEIDAVLARALAKAPGDRWPSCGAFADALDAIACGRFGPRRSDQAERAAP